MAKLPGIRRWLAKGNADAREMLARRASIN
jgi:hypothetical protein